MNYTAQHALEVTRLPWTVPLFVRDSTAQLFSDPDMEHHITIETLLFPSRLISNHRPVPVRSESFDPKGNVHSPRCQAQEPNQSSFRIRNCLF
jgi:hypothetical protein